MQWLKRTIIVQKLTLVVELWALLSPRAPHRLSARSVIGSVALRKGPRRFCPHRSDRCCALMLTCRNSPLRQLCECCNHVLSSSWPPWLDQFNSVSSRDMCVNWNEQPSALNDAWVRVGECKPSLQGIQKVRVEPATRSAVATCYTPGRGKIVPRNVM